MSQSKGERTRGTDVMGQMFERFHPELVAPLVAWLAHESCTSTGEIFSAGGGRIARVFVAESKGWLDPDLTAERVRDAWADICSADRPMLVYGSMREEIAEMVSDFSGLLTRAEAAGAS
jgi:hypothetical protein